MKKLLHYLAITLLPIAGSNLSNASIVSNGGFEKRESSFPSKNSHPSWFGDAHVLLPNITKDLEPNSRGRINSPEGKSTYGHNVPESAEGGSFIALVHSYTPPNTTGEEALLNESGIISQTITGLSPNSTYRLDFEASNIGGTHQPEKAYLIESYDENFILNSLNYNSSGRVIVSIGTGTLLSSTLDFNGPGKQNWQSHTLIFSTGEAEIFKELEFGVLLDSPPTNVAVPDYYGCVIGIDSITITPVTINSKRQLVYNEVEEEGTVVPASYAKNSKPVTNLDDEASLLTLKYAGNPAELRNAVLAHQVWQFSATRHSPLAAAEPQPKPRIQDALSYNIPDLDVIIPPGR